MRVKLVLLIELLFSFFSFLISIVTWAAPAELKLGQKAQVGVQLAYVYNSPDFDSKVISTLPQGTLMVIESAHVNQAFYKVKIIGSSTVGYVSDAEIISAEKPASSGQVSGPSSSIKPGPFSKNQGTKTQTNASANTVTPKQQKRHKVFSLAPFVGASFYLVNYKEKTAGSSRAVDLLSVGLKVTGANLLVNGELPTELNFIFSNQIPIYYEELTQQLAGSAMTMIADGQFLTPFAGDARSLVFIGFGPMLKYSNYEVTVKQGSTHAQNYQLTNINAGVVASLGFAARLRNWSVRADIKYYIEKSQYTAAGISLLKEL